MTAADSEFASEIGPVLHHSPMVSAESASVGTSAHGTTKALISDQLLEDAIAAAKRYATSLGDSDHSSEAWRITLRLKAMRRSEVVARMDAERLQRARGR